MKRAVLIIGGGALLLLTALIVLTYLALSSMERMINDLKTRPMRNARWKNRGDNNVQDVDSEPVERKPEQPEPEPEPERKPEPDAK